MKNAVIGILAHVDAGKTTLSEAMLFRTGYIRKLGRVDHQDSFLDQEVQERERGITIFSKQARMELPHLQVTLLDTPGHVDFSSEMERTLQVLDYAILLISGSDGVQSHTRTLWRLLTRYQIPTFLFINKMDLRQKTEEDLLTELNEQLSEGCISMTAPDFCEKIAETDEGAMEEFFDTGAVSESSIRRLIVDRKVFPCYFGSALKVFGVDELLQGLDTYLTTKVYGPSFGAKVYKIGRDPQGERLSYLKITGGSLKVKESISGETDGEPWTQKVNQIRLYSGAKFTMVEEVVAGQIAAVTGLSNTYAGEGLGDEVDSAKPLLDSFLSYQVFALDGQDIHTIHQQMRILEEEDPKLHVLWNPELQRLHVQLMGEVQLQVLERLMKDRFHTEISFGPGAIMYRETIAAPMEGVGHYEPLRHYAEVHLLLEPGERGSGLTIQSKLREDVLDKSYQHLILTHLQEKTHLGVLTGSPITDMIISLVGGAASVKHTVGGDFREATYRALRQGLMEAKSILLEPWYDFELLIPAYAVGRAVTDLELLHAEFESPEPSGDGYLIKGSAPVASMQDYANTVQSYTRGDGVLTLIPHGYQPCHNEQEVLESFAYDPDQDLNNPAASIFCAHGAGFFVPWYEVPSYMHLETPYSYLHPKRTLNRPLGGILRGSWEDEPTGDEEDPVKGTSSGRTRKSTVGSVNTLEQDKELMAIFERTYGKVKETDFHPVKKAKKEPPKIEEAGQRRERISVPETEKTQYLLVDGYNILYGFESLRDLARSNIDLARDRLMDLMCAYQTLRGCTLILVFDAYNVHRDKEDVYKYHNIYVVYTKQAETADTYIERATYELKPNHVVRVATSDGAEQMIVLGHGALRVSAREFEDEILQVKDELERLILQWNKTEKATLTQNTPLDIK